MLRASDGSPLDESMMIDVESALRTLELREAYIGRSCFAAGRKYPLIQIDHRFDRTPERVRQIIEQAVRKVRPMAYAQRWMRRSILLVQAQQGRAVQRASRMRKRIWQIAEMASNTVCHRLKTPLV